MTASDSAATARTPPERASRASVTSRCANRTNSKLTGEELYKDVVRRILLRHYPPAPDGGSPSWLAAIGHAKDRLWSVDLFRVESILLKSYWILVVMDVYTRRIVGFGVAAAHLDGIRVCRMFNRAIARQPLPRHVSSDHDPLFRFHRWRANLRVLEVEEIKPFPVPHVRMPSSSD